MKTIFVCGALFGYNAVIKSSKYGNDNAADALSTKQINGFVNRERESLYFIGSAFV